MSGPVSTPPPPSPPRSGQPPQGPSQPAGRLRFPPWLWVAILVGLLVWNAFLFLSPMSGPVVTVPYSTFLAQARASNVAAVTINGQAVTGTFRTAIVYPSPDPSASADALGGRRSGGRVVPELRLDPAADRRPGAAAPAREHQAS